MCQWVYVCRGWVDAEAGYGVSGERKICGVCLSAAGFLGVCLSTEAAASSGSEINSKGVAISRGYHAGTALSATMLHTSLVRCDT